MILPGLRLIQMGLMPPAQRCRMTQQGHTATRGPVWDKNSQLPRFQPGEEWISCNRFLLPTPRDIIGPHPTCTEDPGAQCRLAWPATGFFLQEAWLLRAVWAGLVYLLLSLISFVGDKRQVPREDQCIKAHYSIIALDSSAKNTAPLCCQSSTIN